LRTWHMGQGAAGIGEHPGTGIGEMTERAEEGALPLVELIKHKKMTAGLKLHDNPLRAVMLQCDRITNP
jgi:hypothetical protein